jgi:GNAT superfamily N-acetyltransferase
VIRFLRRDDLPDLLALSTSAGWNQTEADWFRLLDLSPNGCWGVELEGRIVSSATLAAYGGGVGWIGMVLTLPEYRGRGFASSLLRLTIDSAKAMGIDSLRLDATDLGRPVYEKLGFQGDYEVQRCRRDPGPVSPISPLLTPASAAAWTDLDPTAFGAERSALLQHLARTAGSAAVDGGFAFSRPGRTAWYFGPAVAVTSEASSALVDWFLAGHGDIACCWDLCPENTRAVRLARKHGFVPVRLLLRMTLGRRCDREPSPSILALAGFEWG